jgi:hypothetical protein
MENYIPQLEQGKKNLNGISIIIPGLRFRPSYPAESCRKDAGKSPYPVGKHRKSLGNGSSIPTGSFSDFSGGFLPTACTFR